MPAPSRLSPYGSNTDELKWREQHVLDLMHDQGYLNDADWKSAKAEDVMSHVKPHKEAIFAPHFSLYVKELLADQYGEAQVEQGGLNVITTLDYDKQVLAEKAVDDGMPTVEKFGGTNAGLVSLDPKTGQVLALVGSVKSTQILAMADAVKGYAIPMMIGGTNATLTKQGNPWLFRVRPDDSIAAAAMVLYIKEDSKLTKVGILHDSDAFGTGGQTLSSREPKRPV